MEIEKNGNIFALLFKQQFNKQPLINQLKLFTMRLEQGLEIKDFISLINGRVVATINRYLNREFKQAGLSITTEQWSVLACLWELDGQTQQSICEKVFKDRASVTRLIDILERNEYVIRVSDKSDRRINLIYLTDKGKQIEQTANNIIKESVVLSTKNIKREEFYLMTEIFKKIINNIEN